MCENSENLELNPQVYITNSPDNSDIYEVAKRLLEEADLNPQLSEIKGFTNFKKLGEGGFGEVYLACYKSTEKQVAIKIMHNEFAGQSNDEKRFKREIKNITFLSISIALKREGFIFLQSYTLKYLGNFSLISL